MPTPEDATGDGRAHAGSSTLPTNASSGPARVAHEEPSRWTTLERLVNKLVAMRHESRHQHEEGQRTSREQRVESLKRHAKEMGVLHAIVQGHGNRLSHLETRVERIERHIFKSVDSIGLLRKQRRTSGRTSSDTSTRCVDSSATSSTARNGVGQSFLKDKFAVSGEHNIDSKPGVETQAD